MSRKPTQAERSTAPRQPEKPPEVSSGLPSWGQVIRVIILDAVVLAELAFAVYAADALRDRWDFTLVFCFVFFGLLIPTLLVARFLTRRAASR